MNSELARIIQRQDGLITRLQALVFITEGALRHLLTKDWQIVLPGVYAAFTGRVSPDQQLRAALLYAGENGRLSDVTALDLYGVRYLPADPSAHVLIPAVEHRANKNFVVVRRTHRLPDPRSVRGFACVPPERAVVEAVARIGDRRVGRAIAADAVQRRIADLAKLAAEAPHITGQGSGLVRDVVTALQSGGRSAPELDFLDMCRRRPELPEPLANPLLQLPSGKYVSPDAFFLDAAVAHETNGRRYHEGEDEFESMQERHDGMTSSGIVVLHNAPARMNRDPEAMMDEVVATVLRYRGRGLPPGVRLIRRSAA